jgi:hypothetical protein
MDVLRKQELPGEYYLGTTSLPPSMITSPGSMHRERIVNEVPSSACLPDKNDNPGASSSDQSSLQLLHQPMGDFLRLCTLDSDIYLRSTVPNARKPEAVLCHSESKVLPLFSMRQE